MVGDCVAVPAISISKRGDLREKEVEARKNFLGVNGRIDVWVYGLSYIKTRRYC